jgi:uncharacterized membrane protein YtjA (UPF0391 family)
LSILLGIGRALHDTRGFSRPQRSAARALQRAQSEPHKWRSVERSNDYQGELVMLYWAAVFFIIALAAAVFGFGGIAAGAAGIAKILFFVFLIFGLVSLVMGRRPTV